MIRAPNADIHQVQISSGANQSRLHFLLRPPVARDAEAEQDESLLGDDLWNGIKRVGTADTHKVRDKNRITSTRCKRYQFQAWPCLCACARIKPANDINVSVTFQTALIIKHVLAGTVHFDVGLLVHTMHLWGK